MGKTKIVPKILAGIIAAILLTYGCTKRDAVVAIQPPVSSPFDPASIKDAQVRAFAAEIMRQDSTSHFIEELLIQSGIPRWDKTLKAGDSSKMTIYVPLVLKGHQQVNAFIAARRVGNVFSFKLYHSDFFYSKNRTRLTNYEVGMYSRYFNKEMFGTPAKQRISGLVSRSKLPLRNLRGSGNGFIEAKGPTVLTNSYGCVTLEEEMEIWMDPDGDDDPCDCSGNEYIVGYDYTYTSVCNWPTGGGDGGGEGEPGEGWPGGGGSGSGGGGDDSGEWEYDFGCDCYTRITQWWVDDEWVLANYSVWVLPDPAKRIGNVAQYLSVFDNTANSTYKVILSVDQPTPNNRVPVALKPGTSIIDVGHAFLTIKQQKPNGTTVTRSLGFYPYLLSKPTSPVDQGAYQDDSSKPFDVSLESNITYTQISAVIAYLISHRNDNYNLNDNNCTDVALKALDEIGISLPKTIGRWPGGAGCNPGDLGEDIRAYQIADITRQNKSLTGGHSPANNP